MCEAMGSIPSKSVIWARDCHTAAGSTWRVLWNTSTQVNLGFLALPQKKNLKISVKLQCLVFIVTWQNLESPRRWASGHVCEELSWCGKMDLNCDWDYSLDRGPWTVQMENENWAEACILCFLLLTVDAIRPVASIFFCLDFPTLMDCELK